jgi:PKHD-type hydroxylase
MRDNWQLFESCITEEMCRDIINNFRTLPESEGQTFNKDSNARSSKVRWVHGETGLKDFLLSIVHQANATALNVSIQPEMQEMQFGEYSHEYQGKYDWHHDINWENPKHFDRKLSVVVQLSDPESYKGGDFEFAEVETPSEFKKQGSVLIFPSYLTHRVTEVTEGTRYSLVSWVRGPRWR